MKILVRNLSRSTTEAELRALFQEYGAIQSCNLVLDKESGLSKGFGFVEMPQPGDAKAAIKTLNGKEIAGSKIRVKKAEEKSTDDQPPKAGKVSIYKTTKRESKDAEVVRERSSKNNEKTDFKKKTPFRRKKTP